MVDDKNVGEIAANLVWQVLLVQFRVIGVEVGLNFKNKQKILFLMSKLWRFAWGHFETIWKRFS